MTEDRHIDDDLEHLGPKERLEASLNHWLDLLMEKAELHELIYDETRNYRPGHERYDERERQISTKLLHQAEKDLLAAEDAAQVKFPGGPVKNAMTEVALSLSSGAMPRKNPMLVWEGEIMEKRIDQLREKAKTLGNEPATKLQRDIIKYQIGAISKHFSNAAYSSH